MRVRYLGYVDEDGTRGGKTSLTIGQDYVVVAIIATAGEYHHLMLLDDQTHQPTVYPSSHFDLVSDEVPSAWKVRVGGTGNPGHLMVAPQEWLEPGFFENYWGDGGAATIAARAAFDREVEAILAES